MTSPLAHTLATSSSVAHWITWLQHHHSSLVQAMRACDHHYDYQNLNAWHLEGDVWTHTMLVLQSYALTGINDPCVGLTALLHDIGKPKAAYTLHHKQRRVFKGHESISAWLSWKLLQDDHLSLSHEQKTRVFALVALHGSLYQDWFHHQEQFDHHKIARAFYGFGESFWRQLISQIQHDMQGQITINPNQKANLLKMSDKVLADFQHVTIQEKETSIPFVCFIGLPASGKSSFRAHYQFQGFSIISRDDLLHEITGEKDYRKAWQQQKNNTKLNHHIDQALENQFQKAITQQHPIAIDMTNLSRKARSTWLTQLPQHYHKSALVFVCDYDTLYHRNQHRGHKSIPKEVLDDMMLRFEHPLFDEFDQIDYVIDGAISKLSTQMQKI